MDLDGLSRAGKFSFVDGLTGLLSGGQGSESTGDKGRILKNGKLDDVRRGIEAAIGDVKLGSKVLIIDQLDELLAISGEEDVTGLALEGMLFSLREVSLDNCYCPFSMQRKNGFRRTNMRRSASSCDNPHLLRRRCSLACPNHIVGALARGVGARSDTCCRFSP